MEARLSVRRFVYAVAAFGAVLLGGTGAQHLTILVPLAGVAVFLYIPDARFEQGDIVIGFGTTGELCALEELFAPKGAIGVV